MKIGIDLGGTNTKIGVVQGAKVIRFSGFSTENLSPKQWVNEASEIISRWGRPSFIGIGIPGAADFKKGKVHYLPNIPGWEGFLLAKEIKKRFSCECLIDNDATAMALAEHLYGAAKGYDNVLCITLGTGVGGGLIINGRIFRGADGVAGEIGHMPLSPWGKKCSCSGKGCLERYVGNKSLIQIAYKRGLLKKPERDLSKITKLARQGSQEAKAFWQEAAHILAPTIIGVINLLNLDAVVVGGGVAKAGRLAIGPLSGLVKEYAMVIQRKRVKILRAKLSNNAGMIGAAALGEESK